MYENIPLLIELFFWETQDICSSRHAGLSRTHGGILRRREEEEVEEEEEEEEEEE